LNKHAGLIAIGASGVCGAGFYHSHQEAIAQIAAIQAQTDAIRVERDVLRARQL
jgi:hypothetical protein